MLTSGSQQSRDRTYLDQVPSNSFWSDRPIWISNERQNLHNNECITVLLNEGGERCREDVCSFCVRNEQDVEGTERLPSKIRPRSTLEISTLAQRHFILLKILPPIWTHYHSHSDLAAVFLIWCATCMPWNSARRQSQTDDCDELDRWKLIVSRSVKANYWSTSRHYRLGRKSLLGAGSVWLCVIKPQNYFEFQRFLWAACEWFRVVSYSLWRTV